MTLNSKHSDGAFLRGLMAGKYPFSHFFLFPIRNVIAEVSLAMGRRERCKSFHRNNASSSRSLPLIAEQSKNDCPTPMDISSACFVERRLLCFMLFGTTANVTVDKIAATFLWRWDSHPSSLFEKIKKCITL